MQVPGSEHSTPRVSPYRLAAHLASAFTIYAVLVWTTLSLAFPAGPVPAVQLSPAAARAVAGLRSKAHPLAALIGLTALSGEVHVPVQPGPASMRQRCMVTHGWPVCCEGRWGMSALVKCCASCNIVLVVPQSIGCLRPWHVCASRSCQLHRPGRHFQPGQNCTGTMLSMTCCRSLCGRQ